MFNFIPVPLEDHEALLGKDFNSRFAIEMADYYAPFLKKNRKIQLAKETWEYAVADSIDQAQHMGSGNSMIDVRAPLLDLDVKGLSAKDLDGTTTEASFLQVLKSSADHYSQSWKNHDWADLKKIFVDPLVAKHHGTNNLHLFVIVRTSADQAVHYALLKVVPSTLTDAEFIEKMKLHGSRAIDLPMLDPSHGRCYIMIGKRRLELRLEC